jgi:hypothetical protein
MLHVEGGGGVLPMTGKVHCIIQIVGGTLPVNREG